MKNIILNSIFFATAILLAPQYDGPCTLGYWQLIAAAVGALGGLYSSSQTKKANEQLAEDARSSELQRRENAAKEYAKAIEQYNKIREERPGLTLKEYIGEKIEALRDPQLQAAFRDSRDEDFAHAQRIADQATQANVDTFNVVFDDITRGKGAELIDRRNEIALTDDSASRFARALELSAPALGAGTAKFDANGNLIEGQRSAAQVFRVAEESDRAARNEQFGKISDIIASDRDIALRQQQKATDFLNFTNFTDFASQLQRESFATRAAFQAADEEKQFQLARDFAISAGSNQTQQPAYYPDTGSAVFGESISSLIKGLGNYQSSPDRKSQL